MIIKKHTGVDLYSLLLSHVLDQPYEEQTEKNEVKQNSGVLVFGSSIKGRLISMVSENALKKINLDVFSYTTNYKMGDMIPEFTNNSNSVGCVGFTFDKNSTYDEVVAKLKDQICLHVI